MTTCIRCHRPLKAPTATGMGRVCARAAAPQTHERDLFGYDPALAAQLASQRLEAFVAVLVLDARAAVQMEFMEARKRLGVWS